MPTIETDDIETEARLLLQEKIERMPWHRGMPADKRERRITEDVETHWPTVVEEAIRRLVNRL